MKRPVKLIIKGVDVLPYVFAVLIIGGYIVLLLAKKGFIHVKRIELLAAVCCGFFLLAIINYFKRIHPPKGISFDALKSTADIRTPNFRYKNSTNSGNTITYIKFYFSEDTAYLYMRSLLKIYEGPISIKSKDSESFHITNFTRINDYEIRFGIESFNGITSYNVLMVNLSEKDLNLLKENFGKMGYELK
ncbi:hypothetical protein [Chryseobacterium taiwanense]|uniref:Uncharacterized protein n=1 Tax=Chryseobacterium taiwanense TaxID=363331 RepID=A0A0B4CKI9_9FLAO|nr:hypothetical protein [Chryseobacterium taiwanense]KIC61739.1 hypothetical protein RM51_15210 [Chryseobacterium taiwanense]